MKIDSPPGEDLLPPMPEPEDIYGMSEGYDGTSMEAYGLQCYEAGVAAERERCAKLCEELWQIDGSHTAREFADAIRAGNQR